jgi:sec-independent protein translocase protein TatA
VFRNPATDIILVLFVLLIIFGPKRLPEIGKGLGKGISEFKDSISGGSGSASEDEQPKKLEAGGDAAASGDEKPAVSATERDK